MMPMVLSFLYLQVLDLITTMVGFRVGASEASPFIAKLIHISSPLAGVAAAKFIAFAIAGLCLFTKRRKLVTWINYWYAGLVIWNLVVILAAINRTAGA